MRGGGGVGNGGDRMRVLLEDPFRIEELSSRALKFMRKDGNGGKWKGKSGWGNGMGSKFKGVGGGGGKGGKVDGEEELEKGKRSPTKISETGMELDEEDEKKGGLNRKEGGDADKVEKAVVPKKTKGNYSHLQAVGARKSSVASRRGKGKGSGALEEPSLFSKMFAKAKRKSGASGRDDVFDDADLKELKHRLRRSSRAGAKKKSSVASRDKSAARKSNRVPKAKVEGKNEKALIVHPTARRSRRRWFLRSSRTPRDKQLIVYQNSYRGDSGKKSGFRLRRLPRKSLRIFQKRKLRFAAQHQAAAEHNASRRLIPNVSMYNDDFIAFMTSAAAKRGAEI